MPARAERNANEVSGIARELEGRSLRSPSNMTEHVALVVLVALVMAGCRREARVFRGTSSAAVIGPYDDNAWAIGEGQRLFSQMNCSGCHSHGGGGMGPALMDGKWRYGEDDASVFSSILGGRKNGMPAYRDRLSDDQAWQLVAYVKTLSGRGPKQSSPVRDDHMNVRPSPASMQPDPISKEEP
jgi:mono/diheme cytochrome c family protein